VTGTPVRRRLPNLPPGPEWGWMSDDCTCWVMVESHGAWLNAAPAYQCATAWLAQLWVAHWPCAVLQQNPNACTNTRCVIVCLQVASPAAGNSPTSVRRRVACGKLSASLWPAESAFLPFSGSRLVVFVTLVRRGGRLSGDSRKASLPGCRASCRQPGN